MPPLTESQARYLSNARVARLATADANGRPHVIPVCFAVAWNEPGGATAIYSVLDHKPKTARPTRLRRVRNIRSNPQATLVVDHYDENWQSLRYILVSCRAELLTGAETEAAQAIALLRRKYPQYRDMALDGNPVIKLLPQRYTSWSYRGDDDA